MTDYDVNEIHFSGLPPKEKRIMKRVITKMFYLNYCCYYITSKGYCYVVLDMKHGNLTKRISQSHYLIMLTQHIETATRRSSGIAARF